MIQVVKGTVAALGSYVLAVHLLDSQIPSFAPFAALLVTQMTVYRSLLHALRYFVAVVVGLVCVGAIGLTLGESVWALAVLVFVTLMVGQWPRLRSHGPQVTIVGVFTFVAGASDEPAYLASLLATVVCGAVVGSVVNVAFAGPIRFSDADAAIIGVAWSIQDLLTDMAAGLRSSAPFRDCGAWHERSDKIVELARRAGAEIDFGEENVRLNPRRLGKGDSLFLDHRHAVDALGRMSGEVQGIVRAVEYADRDVDDDGGSDLGHFLPGYADLLDETGSAVRAFGDYYGDVDPRADRLSAQVGSGLRRHQEMADRLHGSPPGGPRTSADAGAMLVEAERLLRQVEAAQPGAPEDTQGQDPAGRR